MKVTRIPSREKLEASKVSGPGILYKIVHRKTKQWWIGWSELGLARSKEKDIGRQDAKWKASKIGKAIELEGWKMFDWVAVRLVQGKDKSGFLESMAGELNDPLPKPHAWDDGRYRPQSVERRKKVSKKMVGLVRSVETKEKLSVARCNRKREPRKSPESVEKQRRATAGISRDGTAISVARKGKVVVGLKQRQSQSESMKAKGIHHKQILNIKNYELVLDLRKKKYSIDEIYKITSIPKGSINSYIKRGKVEGKIK